MELSSHEAHFWLRHARRAQEPVIIMGQGARAVVSLLDEQGINAETAIPFTPPRRVGMAGLMLGTFATLGTVAERRETLQAIHGMLPVGGKIVIPLWMPTMADLNPLEGVARLMASNESYLMRWRVSRCNLLAQSLEHTDIIEAVNEHGAVQQRTYQHSIEFYVWPNEMRLLLQGASYEIESVFGGWNDEPLTESASIQLWVARKGI